MLDKKCNFALRISEIDEEAISEFKFACFFFYTIILRVISFKKMVAKYPSLLPLVQRSV